MDYEAIWTAPQEQNNQIPKRVHSADGLTFWTGRQIVSAMIDSKRTRVTVGKRITALRHGRQLTLTALAVAAKVDTSHLWRIEHGTGTTTLEGYQRIAAALGVEWPSLFDYVPQRAA